MKCSISHRAETLVTVQPYWKTETSEIQENKTSRPITLYSVLYASKFEEMTSILVHPCTINRPLLGSTETDRPRDRTDGEAVIEGGGGGRIEGENNVA